MCSRSFRLTCLLLSLFIAGASAAPLLPRPSPEFAINLPSGGQVLLSQHRGKVVVMVFVLTTCPHCQTTTVLLSKLQREYGPRGFQVLESAFNDMAGMLVPEFVSMTGADFPVGASPRETVLQYLGVPDNLRMVVPQMVLIDRNGNIRYQSPAEGGDKFFDEPVLRSRIEELLKERAGAARPASSKRK